MGCETIIAMIKANYLFTTDATTNIAALIISINDSKIKVLINSGWSINIVDKAAYQPQYQQEQGYSYTKKPHHYSSLANSTPSLRPKIRHTVHTTVIVIKGLRKAIFMLQNYYYVFFILISKTLAIYIPCLQHTKVFSDTSI